MLKIAVVMGLISLFIMVFCVVMYCVERDNVDGKKLDILLKLSIVSAVVFTVCTVITYIGVAKIVLEIILKLFEIGIV